MNYFSYSFSNAEAMYTWISENSSKFYIIEDVNNTIEVKRK